MTTPIDVLIPAIEKDLATLPHVIEADTVLIRSHVLKTGDKTVFHCRNWSQPGKMILKQAKNKSLHLSSPQISPSKMFSQIISYRSISFHKRKGYLRSTKADAK